MIQNQTMPTTWSFLTVSYTPCHLTCQWAAIYHRSVTCHALTNKNALNILFFLFWFSSLSVIMLDFIVSCTESAYRADGYVTGKELNPCLSLQMNAGSLQYFARFYTVHNAICHCPCDSLQPAKWLSPLCYWHGHPLWHGKCPLAAFKVGKLIIFPA